MSLTLYQYPLCPFCAKVRRAMRNARVEFTTVDVAVGDEATLAKIGHSLLPVLEHDGKFIPESADICRYVESL